MYKIERMPHSLEIGYVGEKNFRPVEIDMTAWMEKMPEGVPSIVCIRPGETKDDAYIAVTTFEDNILTWVPSDADLGVMEGEGMIQVWLEEEENSSVTKRGKSIEVITKVKDSVSNPSADTPAPQASFLEQMTELKTASVNAKTAAETAKGKAEDAQEDAEDAAEDAEAYAKGTRDGSAVTSEDPAYHNNAKYYAEEAGTSATSAGTSATNAGTAKENAEAYAVGTRNGTPVTSGDPAYHNNAKYYAEQVDPTSIIDDTAGEGQTGKTWSADKLDEEFGDVLNAIQGLENDTDTIKETLGLDGTVVDYGTDFPLEITAEEGETVNLTFDTAQSYFVTNKNLIGSANESFTNWKKVSLPFRLPAGTYTLSALVTTTDTDKTYSNFVLMDGSTGVATYYLERDVRKARTFTTAVPFDSIVFYASDDQTHGQGDTATWSDILLEKNGSATSFEAPNGYAESVGDSNTITIENAKTFIYTDDFSDVTGYGISGATPVIPPMQQAIQKHDGFFTDNNFEGNQGDKYNVFQSPYALSDMVDEAYIASNGSLLTGSSYSVFMVSPLVPVQKSGLYGIKVSKESNNVGNLINSVNGFCFYGQDGTTAISRTAEDLTSLGNDIYTLNVPEGTAFVRFTIYKVADYTQDRTLAQFNQWILLPDANSSINDGFFVLSTPKETGYADKIIRSDKSYVKLCSTELHEKKILVFGDSIWGNDRTDGVADFLKKYCGATIYNCAIGGTWICGDRSDYSGGAAWRAFDGVNLINAKLTDTWTDQDTYKDSVTSYAPEVLTLLKTVDMTKIDILILSYGTNDFSNNKTAAAIKSAYETVISAILTEYPRIRILICTPAWRMFNGTDDGDTYQNSNNETIRDIGDAIVEMAKSNHVTVQNMFEELPWRALTKAYYLDSDEVHPNTEGNKVYAHVVHGKLRSMY